MGRAYARRMNTGVVTSFDRDEGWGTLASEALPSGALAWVHYSVIEVDGFRELVVGEGVLFDFERLDQDGYRYRATRVIRSEGPSAENVR